MRRIVRNRNITYPLIVRSTSRVIAPETSVSTVYAPFVSRAYEYAPYRDTSYRYAPYTQDSRAVYTSTNSTEDYSPVTDRHEDVTREVNVDFSPNTETYDQPLTYTRTRQVIAPSNTTNTTFTRRPHHEFSYTYTPVVYHDDQTIPLLRENRKKLKMLLEYTFS